MNLSTRCNWCEAPLVLHTRMKKRWHRFLCSIAALPESYECRPLRTVAYSPEMPSVERCRIAIHSLPSHVNRMKFEGVLGLVDVPSDRPPKGARGHRVLLTWEMAEESMHTLLGMCLNYRDDWDGHDVERKAGIITSARIDGNRIVVGGYIFADDYPNIVKVVNGDAILGMSYEMRNVSVEDMRQDVWTLKAGTFVGAAIVMRYRAAYTDSSFTLLQEVKA